MDQIAPELIAAIIRIKIEELLDTEMFNGIYEDLCGACAICSVALCKSLKKFGYKPDLVNGMYEGYACHCWVELDGKIYDITATQFGLKDKVFITDVDDFNYLEKEYINNVEEFFKKWVGEQKPYKYRIEKLLVDDKDIAAYKLIAGKKIQKYLEIKAEIEGTVNHA
jgi:hypothetical protein